MISKLKSRDSEKKLLLLVSKGDKKAFEELFYAHHNKLGGFALGWTKSPQIAEEIVQDVFLKIWNSRVELGSVLNFDNYLFILARNHTYNILRQMVQERIKNLEWAKQYEKDLDGDDLLITEDLYSLIEKAVDQLPKQQQKVYILKRQEGLKYDEIALQLNISPETARKHLAAALRNITSFVKANQISGLRCLIASMLIFPID